MRTIRYKGYKIVTHKANHPDPARATVSEWNGPAVYYAASTRDAKAWVDSKVDKPKGAA
jgi:hypothetical protein